MLVRWSARPANVIDAWRGIDRLFDETFGLKNGTGIFSDTWVPMVDVAEDDKAYEITVEVPGVAPEDLKINVEGKTLTVSGEKKQETRKEDGRVHRFERRYGSFTRTFTLPETVDGDAIEAKTRNGVLTLMLPKIEKAKPRAIPVVTV